MYCCEFKWRNNIPYISTYRNIIILKIKTTSQNENKNSLIWYEVLIGFYFIRDSGVFTILVVRWNNYLYSWFRHNKIRMLIQKLFDSIILSSLIFCILSLKLDQPWKLLEVLNPMYLGCSIDLTYFYNFIR